MKYTINPDIIEKVSNDILIIISTENKNVHCSTEVGILIWECLKSGKSNSETLAAITDTYEVQREAAEKDMQSFIDELLENDLIRPAP